jgi:hypothetical protein
MAKLNQTEMRAVVDTVMLKIKQANSESPEQLAYEKQVKLKNSLKEEVREESFRVVEELKKKYEEKYPELSFDIRSYNNYIEVDSIQSPPNNINSNDIERELIIANISGNIQETMETIVNKYTNK